MGAKLVRAMRPPLCGSPRLRALVAQTASSGPVNLCTERTSSAKPRLVAVRNEADQAQYVVERILENREEGGPPQAPGSALSHLLAQRAAGSRGHPAQHPVRQILSFSTPLTSRTSLRCCGLRRIRVIGSPVSARCTCCQALVRLPRNEFSTAWRKLPIRSRPFPICRVRPAPATTGPPSCKRSETSDIRNGRRTSNAPVFGTNRVLSGSLRMPTFAAPTSCYSNRSPAGKALNLRSSADA
jgi:hypothetical protein